MTRSGLSAICMTFAVDYQRISEPSQGYDRFVNGLTSMDEQLAGNGMKRSLNLADIRAAHAAGKPTRSAAETSSAYSGRPRPQSVKSVVPPSLHHTFIDRVVLYDHRRWAMRTVTTLFAAASLAAVLCGEYAFAQRHEVLVDAHGKDVKD